MNKVGAYRALLLKIIGSLLFLSVCMYLSGCAGCGTSQEVSYAHYAADEQPSLQQEDEQQGEEAIKNEEPASAPSAGGKVIVKMIPERGIYKIPVSINGQVMDFYFDTGAGMISISEVELAFLMKQGKISEEDFVGTANFTNADGVRSSNAIVKLKDVTIGNKTIHDVEASVVPNSEAPLLLGQSFLAKFGKISIDYQSNEISFE